MIKNYLMAFLLFTFSQFAMAASQCNNLEIENEFHLEDQEITIYQNQKEVVRIQKDNTLYIDKKEVTLDAKQQALVTQYRQHLAAQIPKIDVLGQKTLTVANGVADDVSESFGVEGAFDGLKITVKDFYTDLLSRYYQNDVWIFKKNAIEQAKTNWPVDLKNGMDRLNSQAMASTMSALAEQMDSENGLDLMKLQLQISNLSTKLKDRFEDESQDLKQDFVKYCHTMQGISMQETILIEKIPALKSKLIFHS